MRLQRPPGRRILAPGGGAWPSPDGRCRRVRWGQVAGLVALLLVWPSAGPLAAASNPVGAGAAPQPHAVIVQLEPGDTAGARALAGPDGPAAPTGVPGLYRLPVATAEPAAVAARLATAPGVRFAEPEGHMEAFAVEPDDPSWPDQWANVTIDAPRAWEVTTGSSDVTVAVLDTGVADHPEFEGRLLPGRDAVDDTDDASDVSSTTSSHGTAVAGILAARGDNATGLAGMCWECQILPVRVLDADGNGRFADIAEGIRWAVDNGADILNMSFGSQSASAAVEDAIRYADANGVALVASAGNYNSTGETWPAAMEEVVGVAASRADDTRFDWSSHGWWADVAAPGCAVGLNRLGGTNSGERCGTSFGTPLVSGIVALLLSDQPDATPAQLRAAVFDGAVDVGTWVRRGRVDAGRTLTGTLPDPASACPPGEVPPSGFPDIAGNVHRAAIDCAAWYRIAEGLSGGSYGPALPVRRDQMASILARMLQAEGITLPEPTTQQFGDIAGNVHRQPILQLAELGVVQGRTPSRYEPGTFVRRDQMASFVARAHEVATGGPLPVGGNRFDDLGGNVHRTNVEALAEAGIVEGVRFRRYAPDTDVRRDQIATFATRHLELLASEGHSLQR